MKNSNKITINSCHKNLMQLEKCICRIANDNKINSLGFFLKLKKGKDLFYCLISCGDTITKQFIKDKQKIAIIYNFIYEKNKKVNIQLNKDERFIRAYTYLDIDATVVQIFPDKKEIEEQYFYEINETNILNNYDLLTKNNIHILQFPEGGNILSYSQGKYLDKAKYKLNEFYHSIPTENDSSGSPIFILNNDKIIIFGINRGKINDDDDKNLGYFIFPILDSLKRDSMFLETTLFTVEIIEKANEANSEEKNIVSESIQKGLLLLENENKIKDKMYIGELYHYKPNGRGILYKYNEEKKKKSKKIIYYGDFVKGKYQGNGIIYYDFKNKDYYEGEFYNNLRHGKGKYYEKNKLKYEGEFTEDKYNGKGKIYYEDGLSYEGEFLNGDRKEIEKDNNNSKINDEKEEENDNSSENYDEKKEVKINSNNNGDKEEEEENKEENKSNNKKVDNNNDGFPLGAILENIKSNEREREKINDVIGNFLDFGRCFLNDIGIDTSFTCENCGCSTDDHEHIGNSIWKCKKCNQRCKNEILDNLLE